jgi:cytidine deaminase
MNEDLRQELCLQASKARERAYAPYSRFAVGAALRCADGAVVTAANVENAVYGLSICAERAAVCRAISEGRREFTAIAIAASPLAPPCGACRQFLVEFSPRMEVTSFDPSTGRRHTWTLANLLPESFRFAPPPSVHLPPD